VRALLQKEPPRGADEVLLGLSEPAMLSAAETAYHIPGTKLSQKPASLYGPRMPESTLSFDTPAAHVRVEFGVYAQLALE
jgi:hypothetical protein